MRPVPSNDILELVPEAGKSRATKVKPRLPCTGSSLPGLGSSQTLSKGRKESKVNSNSRTVWIIVAVIVSLLICCCALIALATTIGVFSLPSISRGNLYQEQIERTFEVGDEPFLDLNNGAGSVTIRPGPDGIIHLQGTKKASSRRALNEIRVRTSPRDGGLEIDSRLPEGVGNRSVDLLLTVPSNTRLNLDLGAGQLDVSDIVGQVQVDSGAGDVRIEGANGRVEVGLGAGNVWVTGARGSVDLALGAGNVEYEGNPEGDCTFATGVGNVNLLLPRRLNAEVDLSTAVGRVVIDHDVQGQVSSRDVIGIVGSGNDASIHARSSAGEVTVRYR
jgi:hypothetical protein